MSVLTLESLAEAFAQKDAEIERLTRELREEREAFLSRQLHDTTEIERLKGDVEYWHHIATVEKNGLITELCDAFETYAFDEDKESSLGHWEISQLLQRARKAT